MKDIDNYIKDWALMCENQDDSQNVETPDNHERIDEYGYPEEIEKNSVKLFMYKFKDMCNNNFSSKDIDVRIDDKKPNTLMIKFMNHENFQLEVRKM